LRIPSLLPSLTQRNGRRLRNPRAIRRRSQKRRTLTPQSSIEEARKGETRGATIKRFCNEHPSEGDEKQFDRVFEKMAKAEKEKAPEK